MSLSLRAKMKCFLLACLAVFALAFTGDALADPTLVAAYAQDSASAAIGQPVAPGAITLQDVIEAHNSRAKTKTKSNAATNSVDTAAPQLTPAAKQSTEGVMLMQGLKSVLQEPENKVAAPQLQPPHLPGDATAAAASVPAATTAAAPVVKYEPGQEPKNLAKAGATKPAPVAPDDGEEISASTATPESAKPAAQETKAAAAGDCEPRVEAWTRSCADAGYPQSFTGEIKGETRVTCPSGILRDVWVSNSCAAPESEDEPAAEVKPAEAAPAVAEDTSSMDKKTAPATVEAPVLQPAPPAMSDEHVDANCGAASGMAVKTAPVQDLCATGDVTAVSGNGPWRWSCKGRNGGITVSCAAPLDAVVTEKTPAQKTDANAKSPVVEDGLCGSANGTSTEHPPLANLCAKGMVSRVSGNGPWTWACSGMNGGTAAACLAPRKSDGVCGTANGVGNDEMPMADLCNAGYASAVTGNGPWNWTCSGLNGGAPVTCSAAPKRDAVCGEASLLGQHEAPTNGLCSVGKPTVVSGNGPWLWNCEGSNGGSTVSCMTNVSVNGGCGSANGVAVPEAPENDLCTSGKPSRVTGLGPWTWNCVGIDGGNTESCTAPRGEAAVAKHESKPSAKSNAAASVKSSAKAAAVAKNDLCGAASELAALEAPTTDLCKEGEASSVSGSGPWTWSCAKSGHKSACSTLAPGDMAAAETTAVASNDAKNVAPTPQAAPTMPVHAVEEPLTCGGAAGRGALDAPSEDLCGSGAKSTAVHGKGPWNWACQKGKAKISCTAPKLIDAACGAANGTTQHSAPLANLCREGVATAIQGTGPWLWSCIGSGGGVSVSCSAASQSLVRVDGSCGVAASTPATSVPAVNLCDSGTPSHVYGDGPWTWTCSGMNGGIASSCSTQRNVPPPPAPPGAVVNGLCGASNGAAMAMQPVEDLCTSGTATSISGNGPWNWSCLGENSGMTVSCTSLLLPPAPITGVCGAASGVSTLVAPKSGLCSAGISSAVSGKGPWTWSCSGTNGGGAVACVAPMANSGAAMPSLVTPSNEAPAPQAAAVTGVVKSGLVTPRLPTGSLPPIQGGNMPPAPGNYAPIAPSKIPAAPEMNGMDVDSVATTPELPEDAEPLTPPPVRDTLKPSPALKSTGVDGSGKPLVVGNHYVMPDELSVLPFTANSDNMDGNVVAKLDKVVNILRAHGNVRITLTAYADSANSTPREARRLSLSRALAVRDYLTSKGISSGRVDVRALGANVPSGEPDRVDIKVN